MPEPSGLEFEQDDRRLALTHRRSGLLLVFQFQGNVWTHSLGRISPSNPDQATALLAVEAPPGAAPDTMPPSPSFQELHYDPAQQPHQVLLVGKFGPHHYSAVFSINEVTRLDLENESVLLDIDIADRCQKPVPVLSSTYAARSGATLAEGHEHSVSFRFTGTDQEFFRAETAPPVAIQVQPRSRNGGALIQFTTTPDPASRTHRLRFALRFPIP